LDLFDLVNSRNDNEIFVEAMYGCCLMVSKVCRETVGGDVFGGGVEPHDVLIDNVAEYRKVGVVIPEPDRVC